MWHIENADDITLAHEERLEKQRRRPRRTLFAAVRFPPICRQTTPDVERRIVDARSPIKKTPPLSPSKEKNSPFHVLHEVLSLRVAGRGRSLGGVVVIVVVGVIVVGNVVVVVVVLEVGEVPRVDVGRVVRRRDGKLVVLGTAGLLIECVFFCSGVRG